MSPGTPLLCCDSFLKSVVPGQQGTPDSGRNTLLSPALGGGGGGAIPGTSFWDYRAGTMNRMRNRV